MISTIGTVDIKNYNYGDAALLGLPPVPDFKMQPKPKMTKTTIITITIIGVIVRDSSNVIYK